MSVSLQAPPIEIREYFTVGTGLYYLKDVMPGETHYLVEDCGTNETQWYEATVFDKIKKEIVNQNLKTEGG